VESLFAYYELLLFSTNITFSNAVYMLNAQFAKSSD